MTTYNTGNPVPSGNAYDRFDNSQTFDEVINSILPTAETRLGKQIKTLYGQEQDFNQFLINSGFEPNHITYFDGTPLQVDRPTQLIDYDGAVYRVKMPAAFPVMLTGNWASDSLMLVEATDQSLRQDLSSTYNPLLGSALIGRQRLIFDTVAEQRTVAGRFEGDECEIKNYLAGDKKGCDIYAQWRLGTPIVPDDNGMIIQVPGVTTGYWQRKLNKQGRVDGQVYGLPVAPGQDPYEKLVAFDAYCRATKTDGFLGKGPSGATPVYDTLANSMPFSGPRDPGFGYVDFGYEVWSEPGTIFQTTSPLGADVFNLCSMSNWGLRGFPTIRGFLTSLSGSGSNAVSMVFGVKNITIEAIVEDMPTIWKPDGGTDGGHGFTIQIAGGTVNPVENITFRGSVKGCTSGVNIDASLTDSITYPYSNIFIDDVTAEDCFYGFGATGTTPSASIVDPRVPQPNMSAFGRMHLKNCQRPVFGGRLFGSTLEFNIYNDKEKADLIRNVIENSVYHAELVGLKHCKISINSRTLSVDNVLTLGAVGMGGNAFPSTENSEISVNVRYTTCTTEFDSALAGSPPCRSSSINLNGFVSVPSTFLSNSLRTSLKLNGRDLIPTLYPGNTSPEPGPGAVVIFDVPLTAAQTVYAPPAVLCAIGDPITVIRTSAATGGSVSFSGVSVAVGTRANFIYNGSAWLQYP